MIVSCAAGQGELFERELAGLGAGDRRRRGAGAARPRRRDQVRRARAARGRRRLRAERRRARRRRLRRAARAPPRSRAPRRRSRSRGRSRRSGSSSSATATVIEGFSEGGRIPYWVNCGVYVFSPEALERLPEVGDHETTTFQELVARGRLQRVPPRGPVADREHAEGAPRRRRARRLASGMARVRGSARVAGTSTRRTSTRSTTGRSSRAGSTSRGATS